MLTIDTPWWEKAGRKEPFASSNWWEQPENDSFEEFEFEQSVQLSWFDRLVNWINGLFE